MESINEVVIDIITGNKELYRDIITSYYNQIFRFVRKQIKNAEEAKDITQEIFIKVYQNLKKFNPDKANFTTWLYKVSANYCLDYIQSFYYRNKQQNDSLDFDISDGNNSYAKIITDETIDFINEIMSKKLSKKHQLIMHLHYFSELEVDEIAIALKIPKKTVYSAINLSLKKIRKEMESIYE